MNLKLQCKSRMFYAFLMALFSVWGWGQTTIAFNGAEDNGSTLTLSDQGSWSVSSTNTGYPSANRIKTGTKSFQSVTSSSSSTAAYTSTLISNGVDVSGYTSKYIEVWNSSISTSNGNGIDSSIDKLEIYVSQTSTFSSTPDVLINAAGSTYGNIRWGMAGSGVITANAGTQVVKSYSTNIANGGETKTGADAFSKIVVNVPDAWTTVYIKIIAINNTNSEVWCVDDIAIKGTAAPTGPTLSTGNTTSLSGFTYQVGNGPSLSQNFTVTGSNLTNNLDIITLSNNYEFSTANNGTYTTSLSLAPNAGSINQIIYAKLKAGLPVGSYLDVAILGSNGAADKTVTLSGNVTAPVPIVNTSTNSLSGFNYLKDNGPSTEQSFTISGNNLGSDIIITAPTHYEISTTTGNSFSNSINLSQVNGTVSNQTIYVRLKSNFGIGTYNEYITGSFIQPILVKGYVTSPVVISQIYGGGGNSGALYKNDFIELYNKSNKPVSLNGYYLYYASSGSFSNANNTAFTSLPNVTLLPGQYYLIKEAAGNGGTTDFTADLTGVINLSATSGKVALTNSSTQPSGSTDLSIIDFVGFGSANDKLGTNTTVAPSNTTAVFRKNGGATDTRDNANDFDTPATTPNPRNTSSPANITDPNLVVWNGSAWAGTPSATTDVYITGNYNEPNLVPVKDLYVYNGKTLTVNTSVNANNVINNGSIVVNDNSNFFQDVNSIYSGTGNFKVLKNGNSDVGKYAFWSSPVVGQDLNVIYGSLTPDFITEYDTPTDYFVNAGSTTSVFGKGYSIKTPDVPSNHIVTFTGVPNNGTQTFALSNGGNRYNLVGNPYPSDLNLDALYALNASKITSTFYFWDNTSASVTTQSGGTTNNYGYATYNASATSGTSGTFVASPNVGSINPSGNVAKIGQGFFVRLMPNLSNNTSLNFDNSLRVASTGTFFNKNNNAGVGKYWLRLSSSYGTNNTLAVTYSPAASNSYDAFDSKAIAMGSDGFYTVADAQKLIIQGRETFNINDVVPVGTKHFENGNFTIALIQKEGLFNNGQAVYLHDKAMGTYTDLQNGSYSFAANLGENSNRFEIVYKLGVLSTSEVTKDAFEVYRNGEDFFVRNDKNIDSVTIYDASGRQIQTLNGGAKEIRISLNAKGVYLVKAVSQGKEYTKKIIK
ncbi:lamin tail domain-containing protein [Chryseobacterium sp. RR2-3-20]|uniref:lamin tail domain-containing protein n=1 Tax=Chryseobacterium sp. RR2-3-20 TaxID=2787626 RepID=UPI001ADF511B|nr:lamin tail domain-containing protein [Chryseobacterium sp. RR2-3-20]